MVVYNVSFFRNNRIDKLALRGHITFPRHSLLHSMRINIFRLSGPGPPFFRLLCFPALPAYLLRCPQTVKKAPHPPISVRSQSKFCLSPLIYSLRAIASLRYAREILYVASISRLVASRTRMHTHA